MMAPSTLVGFFNQPHHITEKTEKVQTRTHGDLSSKAEPRLSALRNWKNFDDGAGVLLRTFPDKSSVRRDGQENLRLHAHQRHQRGGARQPSLREHLPLLQQIE